MATVKVTMLGKFDVLADGNSVLPSLSNSIKSTQLLKYFLMDPAKTHSVSDLINTFWSEPDKSTNPESALKTMISRIRTSLSNVDPSLKNCILSQKKAYVWNPDIECITDVAQFESICEILEGSNETLCDKEHFLAAMNLYGGDLVYGSMDEDWLLARSMFLHHRYLKMVGRFICFLRESKDYEMIIQVCRVALDIDVFDETLNLELMQALKESGQSSVALLQYRSVTSSYYKYLGIEPTERIAKFYRDLIKTDLAAETDINSIRQELKKGEYASGAFICDYSVFKDIYQLQLRNIERQQNKMFLAMVSINLPPESIVGPLEMDAAMRLLLEVLEQCLRKGDTIARYSSTQYAILLPMINYASGQVVINRVKQLYYKMSLDKNVSISFQIGSMESP